MSKELNTNQNNDINNITIILELISFIFKKKFTVILFTVIISIISLIILYTIPNTYTAKSTFIPPSVDYISSYNELFSSTNINIGSKLGMGSLLGDPNSIYIEILKSRNIKQDIITKFKLVEKFKSKFLEDAFDKLDKIVTIKNNNGLIEISVETDSPSLSANIANEYINKASNIIGKLSTYDLKSGNQFLEKRLEEVHTKLFIANNKLKNFQINSKVVNMEKQGEALISSLSALQTRIILLESELKELQTTYNDNSPKVKGVKSKIASLSQELNKIKGSNKPNLISKNQDVDLLDIPTIGIDYTELIRDSKILEQIYLLLNKEYELSKIREAKHSIVLKVVDLADIPTKKSGPKRTLILIFIIFLSFFVILTLFVLQFYFYKIKEIYLKFL